MGMTLETATSGESTSIRTGFAPDPTIPWRDELLDPEHMGAELGAELGIRVERAVRGRTKYRVGESLRVSYLLESGARRVRVSLRCFPTGAHAEVAHANPQAVYLPHLASVGWVYPGDRRLEALAEVVASDDLQRRVFGTEVDDVTLASYAPEKAATLRGSGPGGELGYAKLFAHSGHQYVGAKYERLTPVLQAAGIEAPELMRIDDEHGLIVISAVPGETLGTSDTIGDWMCVGRAVGVLHSLPLPPLAPTLAPFERATITRLHNAATVVGAVRPDLIDRLSELLIRLELRRPVDEETPVAVLHGDLHAKNVLVDNGRVGFIDLDQAACGAAAAELGSASAALICDDRSTASARRRQAALLEGYTNVAPLPAPPSLAWHTAAALLGERMLRAVNRVRLPGLARLDDTLDTATSILEEAAA